jgi:KaiC/GvpD/RAD55 family RecA-like ATPase
MERVRTGVPGLDEIMNGGIPQNQVVLITGTAGTGKTILCSQYIWTGITKYKENGVYLSFEEPEEVITEHVKAFGWDFGKLEKEGKFAFIRYDPYNIEDVLNVLESTIRGINAKRVVIDSIAALALYVRDRAELRRMIFNMSIMLRKLHCTPLIVSEIVYGESGLSRYGVEEFVADALVVLYYERLQSTFLRAIQIWKLRGSTHSEKLHPYAITDKGIVVYPEQEAFMKT